MKKRIIITTIILIVVLGAYWFKNWMGINTMKKFSLHAYIPFKYLQASIVKDPEPGEIIINESFDKHHTIKRYWKQIWMREEGKIQKMFDSAGFNGSRCLFIKSESERDWSYSSAYCLKVQKGDIFYYDGYVHLETADGWAQFAFITYDPDKNPIKWNYGKTRIHQTGTALKITNRVTVEDHIAFLRFHISGAGKGEFRFDDILLKMLKEDSDPVN